MHSARVVHSVLSSWKYELRTYLNIIIMCCVEMQIPVLRSLNLVIDYAITTRLTTDKPAVNLTFSSLQVDQSSFQVDHRVYKIDSVEIFTVECRKLHIHHIFKFLYGIYPIARGTIQTHDCPDTHTTRACNTVLQYSAGCASAKSSTDHSSSEVLSSAFASEPTSTGSSCPSAKSPSAKSTGLFMMA